MKILISCEHAGNNIPTKYFHLFKNEAKILSTHLGYDAGALEIAKAIHKNIESKFICSKTSRLLIDLNRSLHHKNLFSKFTKKLSSEEKKELIQKYYNPYRSKAKKQISSWLAEGKKVLHLSIHTFTPMLNNKIRNADIGLLYDPKRTKEKAYCSILKINLLSTGSNYKIRFNFPYLGTADGFTTYLRSFFSNQSYLGIEIEVNQKIYLGDKKHWLKFKRDICTALKSTITFLDELHTTK